MISGLRDPLKEVNGVPPSKLKQPTKVSKEEFPVETVEDLENRSPEKENACISNSVHGAKRKKTEADLKEELQRRQQQRMLNSTTISSSGNGDSVLHVGEQKGSTKVISGNGMGRAPTRPGAFDLNRTIDSASAARARRNLTAPTAATAAKARTNLSSYAGNTRKTLISSASTLSKSTSRTKRNETLEELQASLVKRTPNDFQGRLTDTQKILSFLLKDNSLHKDHISTLQKQVYDKDSAIVEIKEVKTVLETDVEGTKKELHRIESEKLELQQKYLSFQEESNTRVKELLSKQRILENEKDSAVMQLNISRSENESLRMTIQSQTGQLSGLQTESSALKINLQSLSSQCQDKERRIEELLIEIDKKNVKISELEAQIREDEAARKKLHNTIQELKGNIRVFCRIRPFVGDEITEFNLKVPEHFEFPPNTDRTVEIITSHLSSTSNKVDGNRRFSFSFDKVFQPKSLQSQVFEEISQLVQSALDGYNTCIFAYGQTGSGKTYTMEGPGYQAELDMPIVDQETRGMIPRAVEQVFVSAAALREKGWSYEMEAIFLEIYNEQIRDLLCMKPKEEIKYEIKHDSKGNTSVTGITIVKVRSPSQVYELLHRASKNRAVGKTEMNERSSRSHSVFQLKLTGTNRVTEESVNGLLNLIDLAGSERLNQSGATGQRLKETQHINKSLTHLGDVIAALANKDAHIPYRNSKLTYLLQNSLGGNSKTLMFVNISPRLLDLNESISSLRFATKVNACEIGTAKKQNKIDFE